MSALPWSVTLPQAPMLHFNSQQITPKIPDGANQNHYVQIRSPSRRTVAHEATVTLRKNKRFSPLVEQSYVRLDLVCFVPFAILLAMPRTGMQLMLRAVSMEKIMEFYSKWGWDQAWGQAYGSLPEHLQSLACHHDQNDSGAPESTKQGGNAGCPQVPRQTCQILNSLASSDTVKHHGDAQYKALAGSDSTESGNSANRPDDQEDAQSEEGPSDCARKDMVYAGDAHCAVLARLLQEAQQ